MTELTAKPRRSVATLIWLVVSQVIALASLGLWVIAAGTSLMAFDQGDSAGARRFVLMVWAYPIFPLVTAIGAWIAFAFRKNRLATILSGLSFVPMGLLYLALRFGW